MLDILNALIAVDLHIHLEYLNDDFIIKAYSDLTPNRYIQADGHTVDIVENNVHHLYDNIVDAIRNY